MIQANASLKDALATHDLEQRKQNLHYLYSLDPMHTPTIMAIVENEWALGNFEAADQLLRRLLTIEPKEALWPLLILHARLQRRVDGIDRGLETLEQAAKLTHSANNNASDMIKAWQSERQAAAGDPEKLFELKDEPGLKELAKSKSPEALFRYGLLLRGRDARKCFSVLEKATKEDPENPDYLARYIEYTPSPPKKFFERAYQLAESHPDHVGLAWIHAQEDDLEGEEHKARLHRVLQLDPAHAPALASLGRQFEAEGHPELAIPYYDKALETDPKIHVFRGYVAHRIRNQLKQGASDLLYHAPSILPHTHPFFEGCAHLLTLLDDSEQARARAFLGYHEVTAANEYALNFDFETGGKLLGQAVQFFPERPEPNLMAANMYAHGNMMKRARPFYEQAIKDYPDQAFIFELLGDCYFAEDIMSDCIDAYEQAHTIDPQRPGLNEKLEDAKRRKRQKVGQGILTGLAVLSMAGGMASPSGPHIYVPYMGSKGVRRAAAYKELREQGNIEGFAAPKATPMDMGIGEAQSLLMDFYTHLLDLEAEFKS